MFDRKEEVSPARQRQYKIILEKIVEIIVEIFLEIS